MKIVDEYVEVLRRLGLDREPELKEPLKLLAVRFKVLCITDTPSLHVVQADADGDKFIECVVVLDVGFAITGDKALLALRNCMGIPIRTLKELLDRAFFQS